MTERVTERKRARGLGGRPLGPDSLLFGGALPEDDTPANPPHLPEYDPREDMLALAGPEVEGTDGEEREQLGADGLEAMRALLAPADGSRAIDDWGRSERLMSLADPVLDFYYRYWFRVEPEGIENIPSEGGALLVGNHSGALPPDAPMIMQAIRREHPSPRPLYILGEHWFKGYPAIGMLANKIGVVPAHPANAQRLLGEEGRLALVFPEGQKGSRKVFWQRYRLRRFGRGGFVRTAIRARVPIVPIALVGGEEAMPIFAHMRFLERLTGLIYVPFNHAFPHFGALAGAMYLPAKFRIRFLEPIEMETFPAAAADDPAEVQRIAEHIRGRIQANLDEMVAERKSVWFG